MQYFCVWLFSFEYVALDLSILIHASLVCSSIWLRCIQLYRTDTSLMYRQEKNSWSASSLGMLWIELYTYFYIYDNIHFIFSCLNSQKTDYWSFDNDALKCVSKTNCFSNFLTPWMMNECSHCTTHSSMLHIIILR